MANWTDEETFKVIDLWSEDTTQALAAECSVSSDVVPCTCTYAAEDVLFKAIITRTRTYMYIPWRAR